METILLVICQTFILYQGWVLDGTVAGADLSTDFRGV